MTYVSVDSHSFNELYEGAAILGKALELRWFHQKNPDDTTSCHVTRLPFLSRNLSYNSHYYQPKNQYRKRKESIRNTNGTIRTSNTAAGITKRRRKKQSTICIQQHRQKERYHRNHNLAQSLDMFAILKQTHAAQAKQNRPGAKKLSNPCIKPCKKFPPYIPYCTNEHHSSIHCASTVAAVATATITVTDVPSKTNAAPKIATANNNTTNKSQDHATTVAQKGQVKAESNTKSNANPIAQSPNPNAEESKPEAVPFTARKWRWNPPHPCNTAFELFCNKVKNAKASTHFRKNNHTDAITKAEYINIWNELQDQGKFWMEEAKWDQRRYRYQKALYENAMNTTRMGCVIFSYYYHVDMNVVVQLEKRTDRRCPFCWYDGRTDLGLLMHCHTAHGKKQGVGFETRGDWKETEWDDSCRLMFHAGVDEDRNLHILVKSYSRREDEFRYNSGKWQNDVEIEDDFVFLREEGMSVDVPLTIPFVKFPAEMTCLLESKTRKKKLRHLDQQARLGDGYVHTDAISQYTADDKTPVRQYFHSKTMQPMAPGEWDVDSDEEADDTWAKILSECVLKELGDVSEKEKSFMNIWNRFMESHTVTADEAIPNKCKEFIRKFHQILIKNELRDQFLLHLMNLWDNQLMPSQAIVALMIAFDAYASKEKKGGGEPIPPNCNDEVHSITNRDGSGADEESGTCGRTGRIHDINASIDIVLAIGCANEFNDAVPEPVTNVPNDVITKAVSSVPNDVITTSITNVSIDVVTEPVTNVPNDAVTELVTNVPADVITESVTNVPNDDVIGSVTNVPKAVVNEHVTHVPADVVIESVTNVPNDTITESVTNVPADVVTEPVTNVPAFVVPESVKNVPADVVIESVTNIPADVVTESVTNVSKAAVTEPVTNVSADVVIESVTNVPADVVIVSVTNVRDRLVREPVTNVLNDPVIESVTNVPNDTITESVTNVPNDDVIQPVTNVPKFAVTEPVTNVPADVVIESVMNVPNDVVIESVTNVPNDIVIGSVTNIPADVVNEPLACNGKNEAKNDYDLLSNGKKRKNLDHHNMNTEKKPREFQMSDLFW